MNTVKHLKSSSFLPWRKTHSPFWSKDSLGYLPAIIFGMLVGTYMDLLFVGIDMYSFPKRFLPEIFSIHIAFNLIGLPSMIFCFLYVSQKLRGWGKSALLLSLSLIMSVGEKLAEVFGIFAHSPEWKHYYTFFGYIVFLAIMLSIKKWTCNSIK